MKRKVVSGLMLTLVLLSVSTLAFNIQTVKATPTTWTVDDDGGADLSSIQDAIDAASPGDTIFVYNGTYYENLGVDKGNLRIVGEDKSNTIIDGGGYMVIAIWMDNVSVNEFTVRNGRWVWPYSMGSAILLFYVQSCNISDNIVFNSRYGITSYMGGSNTIRDNTISDTEQGIPLYYSHNNTIQGNAVSNASIEWYQPVGIQVWGGYENVVKGNMISGTEVGIALYNDSYNNTIVSNVITNSTLGDPYNLGGVVFPSSIPVTTPWLITRYQTPPKLVYRCISILITTPLLVMLSHATPR